MYPIAYRILPFRHLLRAVEGVGLVMEMVRNREILVLPLICKEVYYLPEGFIGHVVAVSIRLIKELRRVSVILRLLRFAPLGIVVI